MSLFAVLRGLLIGWLALLALPAQAQEFPKLTGRVVDNANLLDAGREAALTARLEQLEQSTGRQLVVATLPDLGGYEISDYGYQLGRAWGIGQKGENNGTILLVAPNERKVRIEVGYGLEPYLTDALSAVIVQQTILPRFRTGDFAGGIEAGVEAMTAQLQLPPEQAAARQRQLLAQGEQRGRQRSGGGNGGALIFWGLVFLFVILPMLRGGGRRRGRRYRRGGMPVVIWGPGFGGGGGGWGGGGGGFGGGGFSGGGGSFGGGGASGSW